MLDALREVADDLFKGSGGDFVQGTAEDLLFYRGELSAQGGEIGVGRTGDGAEGVVGGLEPLVVDLGLQVTVPSQHGGLGDAEATADGGEAQAGGAETEKFVSCGGGMHGGVVARWCGVGPGGLFGPPRTGGLGSECPSNIIGGENGNWIGKKFGNFFNGRQMTDFEWLGISFFRARAIVSRRGCGR